MSELKILVGADISELKDELAKAQLLLESLKKQKTNDLKIGLDVKDLQRQINDAKANISGLTKQINSSASAFDNHSKSAANGGNTLMQFSRIAQDAPFGIMGIGNNLTATAESFSQLSKSAGGSGNALKAVASSIMGTGGILLAVSLVTSGLTYMSQQGISVADVFNKLSGDFDEYADALKKANLAAYNDDGVVKAVSDVNQLREEVKLAKDGFIDKQKVIEHYNETMGKTAGIVTTLDGVEQQLVKNGDAFIKMQLYKATATLAQAEAAKEMLNQEKISKQSAKDHTGVLEYMKGAFTAVASGQGLMSTGMFATVEGIKSQSKAFDDSGKKMNANMSIAQKYNKMAADIAKNSGFNFFDDNKAAKTPKVKKEAFKKDSEFDRNAEDALQGRYNIEAGIIKRGEEAKYKEMLKGQKAQQGLADETSRIAMAGAAAEEAARMKTIEGLRSDLSAELFLLKSQLDKKLITQEQYDLMAQEQRIKSIEAQRALVPEHQIISDAIVGTIQNMGAALGEALATGANIAQSMGNALLQGLGGLLSAMGDHLIKIGTAAVLAGTVMKLFGTVAGVGAGLAAIAGGVLMKGIGGAIAAKGNKKTSGASNGADGGAQRGAMTTGADVSSPTSSVSSGGSFNSGGGTVVFEIAGQKLIGVLNNTLGANQRLGGSLAIGN